MARNVKTIGTGVVSSPGRAPFVSALTEIAAGSDTSFRAIEARFLQTMAEFDDLVIGGVANSGDRNNGKGDFFNDVISLLLERGSGKALHTRGSIPGLLFENHSLDVAYPATGTVLLTVETKAAGVPRHPGNPNQHVSGRPGSADLEKRIKEAAFKDIDIKGEYARTLGQGGGATSDLRSWLGRTPPRNWLLLSVRVRSQTDLDKTIKFAHIASSWFDGCGLYAYGHQGWDLSKPYEAKKVPTTVELDRIMHDVSTALRSL